jgi:hypothetical protein
MTIVAGFHVHDGLLLCSDSQFTGCEKIYKEKLFRRTFSSVVVSFALSGDDDYGRSIIEDCYEAVATLPDGEQTLWNVRKSIRRSIKSGLRDCADSPEKPQFLIGITTPKESGLFSSRESAIPPVDGFEFRGTGSYIGHYIMKSMDSMGMQLMTLKEAVLVGLCILSAAKRNDANCGGGSQFLVVRGMGSFRFGTASLDLTGAYMDEYERLIRSFMMAVGTPASSEEFVKAMAAFADSAHDLHLRMCGVGSYYRMLLDSLSQLSPESPAGSDES